MALDLFDHTKASLKALLAQGYTFWVESDGNGTVTNPAGHTYTISEWECDCPTKKKDRERLYNGACKHSLALAQIYICPECGQWAPLCRYELPTGERILEYRCANQHIYSFDTVRNLRRREYA
jgi:hypothetical protein